MKGIELIGTLIALLAMFGVSAFMGGIVIIVLNTASNKVPYTMILSPIYPPIKYEGMLLSYLESTDDHSGFQIKKILMYAAYQRNITNVFVEGNKEVTIADLTDTSTRIFNQWVGKNYYMLIFNIDGQAYVLAGNKFISTYDKVTKIRRISIPVYIDAEMLKKTNKIRELPLNVTLDLYVQ
jgi:hypothetical protein